MRIVRLRDYISHTIKRRVKMALVRQKNAVCLDDAQSRLP